MTSVFNYGDISIGGKDGYIEQIQKDGTFVRHVKQVDDLDNLMKVYGITFDIHGNMYTALGSVSGVEDNTPHDVVYIPDDSGILGIVAVNETKAELWKYDFNGNKIDSWTDIQLDDGWDHTHLMHLDIACDSKTVYYTDSMLTVFKYDIKTRTQLDNFAQFSVDSNFIYSAFKLHPQGGIIIDLSKTGNGPKNALCLDSDGTSIWTDEINPPGQYHIFKRNETDGSEKLNVITSLDDSGLNDAATSLACYFHFCMNPGITKFKASDTSLVWFQKTNT